jgi:hypothetical protein
VTASSSPSTITAAAAILLCSPLSTAAEPAPPAAPTRDLAKLREEFLSWKFCIFLHFNLATFNHP